MWRFVYLLMYALSFNNKILLGYCKISPWKMCFLTLSVSKTVKFWMLSGHQYHNWKKSENLIASSSFDFLSLTLRMSYHVQLSITLHNFPGMTLKSTFWFLTYNAKNSSFQSETLYQLVFNLLIKLQHFFFISSRNTPMCIAPCFCKIEMLSLILQRSHMSLCAWQLLPLLRQFVRRQTDVYLPCHCWFSNHMVTQCRSPVLVADSEMCNFCTWSKTRNKSHLNSNADSPEAVASLFPHTKSTLCSFPLKNT